MRRFLLLLPFIFSLAIELRADVTRHMPDRLVRGVETPSMAPIVEGVSNGVVNIATMTRVQNYSPLLNSPFFRRFFDLPENLESERQVSSAGSGVIIDSEQGYVLTNHHVIEGADEVIVKLKDGRSATAQVIGSDQKVDIAVLQINLAGLTEVPVQAFNDNRVGDFVLAIGNPFGLGQTVTSGIISALGRNGLGIQGYEDFIQTDASINPGNSGGALIDLHGNLIGINSAIIAPSGGNVGIGFAIPIEIALSVKEQLIQFGRVQRGIVGAQFQDLTPELAEAFSAKTFQGALVTAVKPGGSAERSGLQVGDIVIEASQRPVNNASDMRNRIGLSPVGTQISVEVIRGEATAKLALEVEAIEIATLEGKTLIPQLEGALLRDYILQDQDDPIGIFIEELSTHSPADRLGLEQGDLIFGVNRIRVKTLENLKRALSIETPYAFRIRRGYTDLVIVLN